MSSDLHREILLEIVFSISGEFELQNLLTCFGFPPDKSFFTFWGFSTAVAKPILPHHIRDIVCRICCHPSTNCSPLRKVNPNIRKHQLINYCNGRCDSMLSRYWEL